MKDLRETRTMGVFPTVSGFGSGVTELDVADNPLDALTEYQWRFGSLGGPRTPDHGCGRGYF